MSKRKRDIDLTFPKKCNRLESKQELLYSNLQLFQKAFDTLNLLRRQSQLYDIVLVAEDIEVPAHKMVLASCSPYFQAMFTSFKESKQDRIILQDIDGSALQLLIDYVYTAKVLVTEENVQVLLPAANLLQLTEVRDACCEFLQSQLHPTNCLGIQAFAELHGCDEFLITAESYVKQHFTEVVECEEFLSLTSQQIIKLISSDLTERRRRKKTNPSEDKVFKCVLSWVRAELPSREQHLAELIEYVRLHLLSSDYLIHLVEEEPLLKNNTQYFRSLMCGIVAKAENAKAKLINLLLKVPQVATTADCWTFHNKTYLGMTVSWLDPKTLARKKAVLAYHELEGLLTHELLAKEIVEVHRLFYLDNKVVSTTIDNSANFVKTFTEFSTSAILLPTEIIGPQLQDSHLETDDKVTPVELHSKLEETAKYDIHELGLPNPQRCAAYTLNLLVTSDLVNIPNWPSKKHYREALDKAQELWNKQKRSTQVCEVISNQLRCKILTPKVTCWKSLYDALVFLNKMLVEQFFNLQKVCGFARITMFDSDDIQVLQEFVQVMKPVKEALEMLQCETMIYNGALLPTLKVLELSLRDLKMKHLQHMEPVVDTLLEAIEKRFGPKFDDEDMLLAAAFHPLFKTRWHVGLNTEKVDIIKEKMVMVLQRFVKPVEEPNSRSGNSTEEEEDHFSLLWRQITEDLKKEVEYWTNPKKIKVKNVLPIHLWFPPNHYSAWIKAFKKYNTAIPSSAAIDCIFSMGPDIMKPTRSDLISHNFEKLEFLKGNSGVHNHSVDVKDK